MKNPSRLLLQHAFTRDFVTFVHRTVQTVAAGKPYLHNWHIDAMGWQLTRVERGLTRNLLITLPPRHLKSICASVAFPAWVLARDPTRRIVCVSYADDLASKLAQDCRAVMQSKWYMESFPGTRISREKNREHDFVTTARGGRYTTTVNGSLTGRGGDIIIVDDSLKPQDALSKPLRRSVNEWFDRTLYSRLDDKRSGAIIVVGQRLHIEDLAGHLLGKAEPWEHLCLPAIAELDQEIEIGPGQFYRRKRGEALHPDHESVEILERARASLGSYNFSAQYQQCPIPVEGEILKLKWFRRYEGELGREADDCIVQSWDTACKATELSDYSVCTTWLVRGDLRYLIDVVRERLLYPDLKRRIIEHARSFAAEAVLVEDKGSGTSLIQELWGSDEMSGIDVIGITPTEDKITRMVAQSTAIEGGRVLLPERSEWLEVFQNEVLQFPNANHDDQIDSMSQALSWIRERDHIGVYF